MPRSKPSQNPDLMTFTGFALPTSNTTYTPNQFFDVCLPHHSRGVVRLVGYMIRKTLGWCDAHGHPQNETVAFSYDDLEQYAGVSHSMTRLALDQATQGGFIRCVKEGQASGRAVPGASSVYELAWDESGEYVKDPKRFRGFFAGEGNRTYIPNQFFDRLLPNESLAVIQVVGTVVRFSIGFQNKYGHRRQQVALSYRDIQRYAKIASPSVLAKALREASAKQYIQRVEEGYFDPNAGRLSRAAHYAVKWAPLSHGSSSTLKSVAEEMPFKNHSEKQSGSTPKSVAGDHTEKRSGIQIKQANNTLKQQPAVAQTFERLKAEGFDVRSAEAIANRYPTERIERQLRLIDRRGVKANRLGMLRTAIEQDWGDPTPDRRGFADLRQRKFEPTDRGKGFADALEATRQKLRDARSH